MYRFLIIFADFSLLTISCKKEFTQVEKIRIEEMLASDVYKLKVPDDAFVFCLDTIKAGEEYERFSNEFCKRGQGVDSYLYLSTYGIYIPILPQYMCDDYIWSCWRNRSYLTIVANKKRQWLMQDEVFKNLNQSKLNSLLEEYYEGLKLKNKTSSALIHFKVNSIKVNYERDSLYVGLLGSYYNFIKKEKLKTNLSLDSLRTVYPFNLAIGEYIVLPPPPPPINRKELK